MRFRNKRSNEPRSACAIAALCLFFVFPVHTGFVSADQSPQRIASTHLCTDQLLLLLSEPENIVSLSYFASNPSMSMMHEQASSYPVNHGLAEELVVLDPELILTGEYGHPSILLLRSLGYRVVSVPVALTVEDIRSNIHLIAEAIGQPERGASLVAEFDQRMRTRELQGDGSRPVIAMYGANGYTTGRSTLRTQIIERAGFKNLAVELGIVNNRHLPLEILVSHSLDAVILDSASESPALADELPNHPALRVALDNVPRVNVPNKMWICGTPFVADALDHLVAFRQRIAADRE